MKKLLLLFSIILIINAEEVVVNSKKEFSLDINYLKILPKGLKRDFYINEYLKTDITSNDAFETLSLIDNMNDTLFFNFAKKFKDDETLAVAQCMNMDTKDLINSYSDCIAIGLSINEASQLSAIDIDLLMQKLSDKYPELSKRLKIVSSSIPFTKLIIQKKEVFYDIYLNVSNTFREKYFNYKLPKRTFSKIYKDKDNFEKFLKITLKNNKLDKLNKFFLEIDDKELNSESSFFLALNALNNDDLNKAMIYLNNALDKNSDTILENKIIFWKYLITKDNTYLETLISKTEVNFYSLLANEILGNKIDNFNFLERLSSFDNQLKEYDVNRVALLYSIAKVDSNFNIFKISDDYKIGLMQLNGKLIENISENIDTKYSIFEQFNENINIKYANIHINSLEKISTNPILTYLLYQNNNNAINKLKELKSFNLHDYNSYFVFEYIDDNKKLKEFISYFYLYKNFLTSKKKDKLTLSSIFESLIEFDQTQDEKVLN